MLISHILRGEEVDIDVTDRREPYEWLIVGLTPEQHDALQLTDDEEQEIYELISRVLWERALSGDW